LNSLGVEVGRAIGAPKRDQVLAALAAIKWHLRATRN
jgi:hypothetical protein